MNSRFFETVEDGFQKAGFEIVSKEWLDAYDKIYEKAQSQFVEEIQKRAQENHTHPMIEGMGAVMPDPEYDLPLKVEGETAIYVLARISGEGNDREAEEGDIFLTESERRTILELNRTVQKVFTGVECRRAGRSFIGHGSREYPDSFTAGGTDRNRACGSCSGENISIR